MKRNKLISIIISAGLIFGYMPAFSEGDVYTVSTAAELALFARRCSVDTWSAGKTVVIQNDIDISKANFKSIPTFGGTFDGQGHTIKGLKITQNGSNEGLFRYIQPGASVKNLKLSGSVEVGGTKSIIGAIAGNNKGTITNCSFEGAIKGKSNIGGIAGINEGTISGCRTGAVIYGEHYVGGIAGKNLGSIIQCENNSRVNTTVEAVKVDIETMNFDKLISMENVADITDIGGIAGYSAGVIQGCTNNGSVGYEHVGYNIGGISGRQIGYISGCKNTGVIYGRKDVGGIVGQMEPYTVLKYSQTALSSLNGELDALQTIVDDAVDSARNSKSVAAERLENVQKYVGEARSTAEKLINQAGDKVNEGIDTVNDKAEQAADKINDFSARTSETADKLLAVSDSMSATGGNIKNYAADYKKSFERLRDIWGGADTSEIEGAVDNLADASMDMAKAMDYISSALDYLKMGSGDTSKTKEALEKLIDGISRLQTSTDGIGTAVGEIKSANDAFGQSIKNNDPTMGEAAAQLFGEVNKQLGSVADSASKMRDANDEIKAALQELPTGAGDINIDLLSRSVNRIERSVDALAGGLEEISAAAGAMTGIWNQFKSLSDESSSVFDDISAATEGISKETDALSGSMNEAKQILREYNESPVISFEKIDNVYLDDKDKLSDNLSDISNSVTALRESMGTLGDSVFDSVDRISNQITAVFNSLADSVDEVKNKSTDAEDYFEDVSEYDDKSHTEGKTAECENCGSVNGDVNVGGITGSMAIEYDFDPEDDVTSQGDKSMNFLYTTKAVVSGCKNSGKVTAGKNCAGGIAGRADIGMITKSLGKGYIKSESGDRIGGIAGYSQSLIRSCYAKSTLSGDDFVGGIAGEANRIYNSYAMPRIELCDENAGSVAGKTNGACSDNFFVDNEFGGIDGISYEGKAQGVSYEQLILMQVPEDFRFFTLEFVADGKTVDMVSFEYGSSLLPEQIPEVPKKEGCYGVWDRTDFESLTFDEEVEAVYDSYITSMESSDRRNNGLSVIVVEGEFSPLSEAKIRKEETEEIEKWSVSVSNCDSSRMLIHYLPPENMRDIQIFVESGGKTKKAKFTYDGSYAVFNVDGNDVSFTVKKDNSEETAAVFIFLFAVAAAAAVLIRKKIKRKR